MSRLGLTWLGSRAELSTLLRSSHRESSPHRVARRQPLRLEALANCRLVEQRALLRAHVVGLSRRLRCAQSSSESAAPAIGRSMAFYCLWRLCDRYEHAVPSGPRLAGACEPRVPTGAPHMGHTCATRHVLHVQRRRRRLFIAALLRAYASRLCTRETTRFASRLRQAPPLAPTCGAGVAAAAAALAAAGDSRRDASLALPFRPWRRVSEAAWSTPPSIGQPACACSAAPGSAACACSAAPPVVLCPLPRRLARPLAPRPPRGLPLPRSLPRRPSALGLPLRPCAPSLTRASPAPSAGGGGLPRGRTRHAARAALAVAHSCPSAGPPLTPAATGGGARARQRELGLGSLRPVAY